MSPPTPHRREEKWLDPADRRDTGRVAEVHTLVDALGSRPGCFVTGGEAHNLVAADQLLPTMDAFIPIAAEAFDADQRVLEP